MEKKRVKWIDLTKGIAILLVVIGHMLRGFTSANLFTEYASFFNYIDFFIYSFHMPIFFIISGYLYMRTFMINNIKDLLNFIKKKFKVLIIPYFIFSWLQITIKLIMAGSVNHNVNISNFYTIFFSPIEQFWFLYVLFFIFIIMSTMDFLKINNKIKTIIIAILFFMGSNYIFKWSTLNTIFIYLIYFYLGRYLMKIKFSDINIKNILSILCIYFLINIVSFNLKFSFSFDIICDFLMAILFSIFIIFVCEKISNMDNFCISILKIIGKYSMSIYLLHTIFGSGIRIILIKMGIESFFVHTLAGIFFGLFPPMILGYIYRKSKSKLNKDIIKYRISL